MTKNPLAGKPALAGPLVDVPRLVTAYFSEVPDAAVPEQRVAFGTSGHRGSSLACTFNEAHVLAITQAICEQRQRAAVDGPLFLGIDTHALSEPARGERARGAGRQRRRGHAGAGRRVHPDTGGLARDPHATTPAASADWRTASSSPPRTTRPRTVASSTTRPTAVLRIPTSRRRWRRARTSCSTGGLAGVQAHTRQAGPGRIDHPPP